MRKDKNTTQVQYLITCTKSELITDQATPQRLPVISYRCFWASVLINNDKKVHLLDNSREGETMRNKVVRHLKHILHLVS